MNGFSDAHGLDFDGYGLDLKALISRSIHSNGYGYGY